MRDDNIDRNLCKMNTYEPLFYFQYTCISPIGFVLNPMKLIVYIPLDK